MVGVASARGVPLVSCVVLIALALFAFTAQVEGEINQTTIVDYQQTNFCQTS